MRNTKNKIAVAILLFINFIFCYKYASRHTEYGLYIALILVIFQYLVFRMNHRFLLPYRVKKIIGYGLLGFIAGLVILSHYKIPLESLAVDRWSVISSFLAELFSGNYPYFAKSHMGNFPGPMPIYFLLASPFYWLGELSLLSALGYFIFIILLIKKFRVNSKITFLLFYLLTSFFLVWEILTRSNLFTFTILVVLVLNEFSKSAAKGNLRFYGLAILTGFMLSTRSIYILPYIIFFLSIFMNNLVSFKKLVTFLMIAAVAFISTFIPFLLFFYDDFFQMNPFIIQSSFLVPKSYTIVFILISIALAFLVKTKADRFFFSGLSLFITIFIYSLYHLINYGYQTSYLDSSIDISYFLFCVPFLFKYLMDTNSKTKIAGTT